jgi:hypothetical protein
MGICAAAFLLAAATPVPTGDRPDTSAEPAADVETAAPTIEDRFEAFEVLTRASRDDARDTVVLCEAEEIAAVAQELWDEGESVLADELLQEAMDLMEPPEAD